MKRLPLILALFLWAMPALAQAPPAPTVIVSPYKVEVRLEWGSVPNVAGYKVYRGNLSRTYQYVPIDVGNVLTYTYGFLETGSHYFAVTAYSINGEESQYSNETAITLPLSATGQIGPPGAIGPPGPPGPQGIQGEKGDPGVGTELPVPRIENLQASAITTYNATIVWATIPECSGTVFYGSTPNSLTRFVRSNNKGTTDHLAVMSPLLSRNHYYYKVQSVCNEETIESGVRSFYAK